MNREQLFIGVGLDFSYATSDETSFNEIFISNILLKHVSLYIKETFK